MDIGSSPRARGTRYSGSSSWRWQQVHPRGRGEHFLISAAVFPPPGSSPRARGTLSLDTVRLLDRRFIPAGAGNTALRFLRFRELAVHPRGRGEHATHLQDGAATRGSSPRARGTPYARGGSLFDRRFIPAGAGNTVLRGRAGGCRTVHPRGRGEHTYVCATYARHSGSSPRARGTLIVADHRDGSDRFIPAGAGNTRDGTGFCWREAVHPRGRGEHDRANGRNAHKNGSSPRARGTLPRELPNGHGVRFIPAGAGNTVVRSVILAPPAVHPRGRGEHVGEISKELLYAGSSPRARGTRRRLRSAAVATRFIPAGAGNTSTLRSAQICTTVHPRGRGEHHQRLDGAHSCSGSSPRARGTLRQEAALSA